MVVRSRARINPVGSLRAGASTVSSSIIDEFATARDRIADQCGLECTEHQLGEKSRKELVIAIVPAGWKLGLNRIKVASISDYRLV
jgi:hypothetical protein